MDSGNTSTPVVLFEKSAHAIEGSDSSNIGHVINCKGHVIHKVYTIDEDPKKKGINQETGEKHSLYKPHPLLYLSCD